MNRTERILRYLDGKMSEHELREFREELKKDPDLLEELDIHRLAQDSVATNDQDRFRAKLAETYDKFAKDRKSIKINSHSGRLKLLYKLAFPLAAIIVLAVFLLFPQKETAAELYAQNYIKFSQNYSTRSSEAIKHNDKLIEGLSLYFSGKYSSAISILEDYISLKSENLNSAHFYLALSAMEEAQMEKAILHFQFVIDQDFSFLQEHCEWYQSLAYIYLGEYELAEENLLNLKMRESFYTQKATKILKHLH